MPKANPFVYFDLGGVVFRFKEAIQKLAEMHNMSFDEFFPVFVKYDVMACLGECSAQELLEACVKELHLKPIANFDFLEWFTDNFIPIQETHALLQKLTATHELGLLTNIHRGSVKKALQKKHIPDLPYAAIVESCEIGLVKPSESIFVHATKKAGVPKEQIFFIDDSLPNIEAAKQFGWQVIQFHTDDPKRSIQEIQAVLNV